MSLIDRYTILKWKESWGNFTGHFFGRLSGLYASCNATTSTRVVSLGVILVMVFLVMGIVSLLRPEPPVPLNKRLVLKATDDQGDTWAMDYLKNQDLQAILNGPVKPGQPLTLTVDFLRKYPNLLMKPYIIGVAGEYYFPGILKNGQWQQAPRFVITDANGKRLHRGQFEYG